MHKVRRIACIASWLVVQDLKRWFRAGTERLVFLGVLSSVVLLEIIPDFCLKCGNQVCGYPSKRALWDARELQLYNCLQLPEGN